jgi:diketogulonate reductase-like aldo/keto reductase
VTSPGCGRVSSTCRGRARRVAGGRAGDPKRTFIATKVWTRGRKAGITQMERSFALLKAKCIDLMQLHNLLDWETHVATLRGWKQDGRIRYLGVTHYTASAYDELETVMRKETLDFVQLNYSLDDRSERHAAAACGGPQYCGLGHVPFGGGSLLGRLGNRPLPDWAGEMGCTSWAQIPLKFVLAQPAVTCVIPGTGNPAHMATAEPEAECCRMSPCESASLLIGKPARQNRQGNSGQLRERLATPIVHLPTGLVS